LTAYAAEVIAAWASRYLPEKQAAAADDEGIVVAETGAGKYQNLVTAGRHHLLADEPASVGGLDSGPNPYDYLVSGDRARGLHVDDLAHLRRAQEACARPHHGPRQP
jgi:hypothetical protein